MVGLLSLPIEILQEIGLEVSSLDVKKMRTVNRHLQLAMEPIHFRSMRIDIGAPDSTLESLANNTTRAGAYVQHLKIDTAAMRRGEDWRENVELYLAVALCTFKVLRSLSWHIVLQDTKPNDSEVDVHRCIWACLGPSQTITALEVIADMDNLPLSIADFGLFEHLEKLVIDASRSSEISPILAEIIRANRQHLSKLRIDSALPPNVEFDQILPEVDPPLRLTHLSISILPLAGLSRCLPHLESLRCLELSGDIDDEIWTILESAKIWIAKLRVPNMKASLLNYLASYSTLECISFALPAQDVGVLRMFYHEVLPKQSQSLVSLALRGSPPGFWISSSSNTAGLRRCIRLETLLLDVPLTDIRYDGGDAVMSLLEAADAMPQLVCFTMAIAGVPPGSDRALNAKIKLFNAITQVRLAQKSTLDERYTIEIQCPQSKPLRYKRAR